MNAQEGTRKKAEERKKSQGSADLRLRGLRLDWSYSPRRAYSSGADFHSLAMAPRERVLRHERGATNAPLRVDGCQFALRFESANLRKKRRPQRRRSALRLLDMEERLKLPIGQNLPVSAGLPGAHESPQAVPSCSRASASWQ